MKTIVVLIAVLLAAPALVVAAASANFSSPQSPSAASDKVPAEIMQVTVNVPASMRPSVSDEIAEVFAERVADALHRQGYKPNVHYLDTVDDPAVNQPLLAINLIEWRTDHVGNVDCTFSGTLVTSRGKKDLGLFTGTSMLMFSRRDWFVRSDQFAEAARQALGDLFERIAETHLLGS